MPQVKDFCLDPTISLITGERGELKARGHNRRQTVVTPGYTTTGKIFGDNALPILARFMRIPHRTLFSENC
jgi:hypothetical protein